MSNWLAAGIDPAQVAEWAGHSVETPLQEYAKCLDGNAERAKRRLLLALAEEDDDEAKDNAAGEGGGEAA
ncbi:hypothetical protein AB0K52_15255 [Glycomyces sp. NPDC049804]|uniref:hypothetical protein n=1 Tax=Glycomyces sp. NPDC049804 TaxID=3154363 RepID=UPI00342F8376